MSKATKSTGPVPVDARSTPGLPADVPGGAPAKEWSKAEVARLGVLLAGHQERLFATAAAGAGIRAFGAPSALERAHHFLWRISRAMPPAGYFGVFNRSHYEDVLVARVRSLVPRTVWQRRYDEINAFERAEAADGTTLIKVMLHISYEEQRERLLARLDDPTKRWKFDPVDLEDRGQWHEYQAAYADVLKRCSAPNAPWYVVPADRKWYRNWAVANILLAHLHEMRLTYPEVDLDADSLKARLAGGSGLAPDHRAGRAKKNTR
jgi:PPK2 family polyphosphate:nucleotide phosphotransferase